MSFMPVFNQTMILFLLIFIGFIIKKKNIITEQTTKDLSALILNVTLPFMMIAAMNHSFSLEMLNNSMLTFVFGAVSYGIVIIIAIIFNKIFMPSEMQKGVYSFLIVFPNTGFMGFPVLMAMFGDIGIFYGAIYNLLFNLLTWTLGVRYMTAHKAAEGKGGSGLKNFMNPGIISVFIGLLVFILPIELPNIIYSPLKLLGDTTTPLAMLVAGAMLADIKISEVLGNKKLYILAFIRLLLAPMSMLLVFSIFKVPDIVKGVLVILTGMPSAVNTAIFATRYNSDSKLASQGVFITTLLNIITAPIIIYLLMSY
ncbi:MAG: AEC family transporter [Tissierellales bacterium]